MKRLNRALLRKVATKLRRLKHARHYRQQSYATKTTCGTAACIAGHVFLATGGRIRFKRDAFSKFLLPVFTRGGRAVDIRTDAARHLGLSDIQSTRLFAASPQGLETCLPECQICQRWPAPFAGRWRNEPKKHLIAADLLDAIADGKVTL